MANIPSTTAIDTAVDQSSLNQTTGPFRFDDPTHRLVVGLAYLIVGVVGVIGNGFVIFAVMISRRLHTITNVFVVNLSVSDLIGCASLPLLTATFVSRDFPYSKSFCAALSGVMFIMFPVSIVNLTLIAINRYTLITKPKVTFDRIYTKRNITLMIIFSWLYVVVVIFGPPAFGVGELGYSKTYLTCTLISEKPVETIYYVTIRSALLPVAGTVITTACYVGIYRFVRKAGKQQRNSSTASRNQINKRQLQVTKNLFIVVCVYGCCFIPYLVINAIPSLKTVLPWGTVFFTANSGINPIVYGRWHPQFNEIFRLILKGRFSEIPQKTRLLNLMCKSDPGKRKAVANTSDSMRTTSSC